MAVSKPKQKKTTSTRHFYKKSGLTKKELFQPKKRSNKPLTPNPLPPLSPEVTLPLPSPSEPSPSADPSPPETTSSSTSETNVSRDPGDIEKQNLERTIHETVTRLAEKNQLLTSKQQELDEVSKSTTVPETINGLSSSAEEYELLSQEIRNYQRKMSKLKNEIDIIKTDFEKEKKSLKKTITDLKQELHRTAPLHDRKYFSLSQEIKAAISEIESNADGPIDLSAIPPESITTTQNPTSSPAQFQINSSEPPPPQVQTQLLPTTAVIQPASPPPKGKDKKLLITGIVLLFFLISGAAVSYQVMSKPKIDPDLVNQYLDSGAVQGASIGTEATIDRYAEIPFDQTDWQGFEDPFYGIRFQYPKNVAEKQKSGNGLAFLRHDGFLFKFQHIQSQLGAKEYWEQTSGSDDSYQIEETKFNGKPALHLTSTHQVDYPGERYLIKNNDAILDLWFAVESDKFSEDDMMRVQRIKDTVSFF